MQTHVLAGVLSLALAACTEAYVLQGRIDGLREVASQAKEQGGIRCAPLELALAEANLEFAELELDQGDQVRAAKHLVVAEANANAALHLSPNDRSCGSPKLGDRDGDGIPDAEDRCVAQPEDHDGMDDADGCPEDQDTDGDGLPDSVDLCVPVPEDNDGYLDSDGCPEEDNDLDGLLDASDQCPVEAEDPDTFQDDDGCPDIDNDLDNIDDMADLCPNEAGIEAERGCPKVYKDVVLTDKAVVITQQVHFQTNRAVIKSESHGLLNTVAQVLSDYPSIRVEVQGHTDDRGANKANLLLSQQRAESVRAYLITRNVEPYRMRAKGYGETRPIDSNKTVSGRAANRRVEFVRIDNEGPKGAHEAPASSEGAPQEEGGMP